MVNETDIQTSSSTNGGRSNVPEMSVSELSGSLKRTLEETFGRVRVRGELSRVSIAASGHMYSDLKDDNALINIVCWKGVMSKISIRPEEGMEVVCTGRVSSYPARSNYQLIIDSMELAGEGALLKLLEDRKKKLAAEGLFAQERKKPLPFLPQVIGVVTSPTGAVIHDIRTTLARRFPRHVILSPVLVQGEGAAAQISKAIRGFTAMSKDGVVPRPDVLIVARGGGSLEDLMAFNEEEVVRAVAACDIPVISSVGHETDTTLIDYVADRRAPTPTAAAEIAVPHRVELMTQMAKYGQRLTGAASKIVSLRDDRLQSFGKRLGDPTRLTEIHSQKIDYFGQKLDGGFERFIARSQNHLMRLGGLLKDPAYLLREKKHQLDVVFSKTRTSMDKKLGKCRESIAVKGARIRTPRDGVHKARKELEFYNSRLYQQGERLVLPYEKRLSQASRVLESLSYQNVLKRGYVVLRDQNDGVITDPAMLAEGDQFVAEFKDNQHVYATISDNKVVDVTVKSAKKKSVVSSSKSKKSAEDSDQGDLF